MKQFGEKLKIGINELIKREVEKTKEELGHSSLLFNEIAHHANHCKKLTNKIEYKSENYLYSIIKKYILDKNNMCPFVVTGPSGAGKRYSIKF